MWKGGGKLTWLVSFFEGFYFIFDVGSVSLRSFESREWLAYSCYSY
jgi:hypothetical protein